MKTVKLTIPQTRIWKSTARFKILIAGRRFGKTTLAITRLLAKALEKRDQIIWYIAPTYRMSKRIAWEPLKALVEKRALLSKNETELSIKLKNGSSITLFGADNPDSLRGSGLDHVFLDEFPLIKKEVWYEAIRPALADKMGSADLAGTPCGFNWAYDLSQEAILKEAWAFFQYTTAQGGNVTLEELLDAQSSMDARIFNQEFNASFETLAGRVYDKFSRIANIDNTLIDSGAELLVGMDFNVNPMSAIVAIAVGDECHVLDSLEIMCSNTDEMCVELQKRYPHRNIWVYPDPAGKQRKTSAPVGQTDFSILKKFGFRVIAPPQAPLITDRVNCVQAMLCDTKGRRRLLIHPRAKSLTKALDGQTYKEGTSQPDKTSGLDHPLDGLGYLIWSRFNLLKNSGWAKSNIQVY